MKRSIYAIITIFTALLTSQTADAKMQEKTSYDFSFKTLMGEDPMPLKQFEGKVMLIVNTASHCGFTPQYDSLEKIYTKYKDRGFVVIGVPSNDFGKQESGSNREIADFCRINYGVTFPMASKEIITGEGAHPFYIWAKKSLGFGTAPKWNFHKYLVDRRGNLIDYFNSTTNPDSDRVKKSIEKALAAE